MMEELKSCPFCGSPAKIVDTWCGTNEIAICCSGDKLPIKSFGCPASNDEQDEQGGFSFSCYGKDHLEKLIEQWNSRPIEDALTETIAEKDKEIKKLEQNVMDVRRVDRDAIEGWQNAFIKTRDEKDAEIERLRGALKEIYEACVKADVEGELSEYVSGAILDAAAKALKDGE